MAAAGVAAFEPISFSPNSNGGHLRNYPVNTVHFSTPTYFIPNSNSDVDIDSAVLVCMDPNKEMWLDNIKLSPNLFIFQCVEGSGAQMVTRLENGLECRPRN